MREIENACKCKVENDSVGASRVITKSVCLNEIVRACACVCVSVCEHLYREQKSWCVFEYVIVK